MLTSILGLQMTRWHDGGMIVGMHWMWWLFWIPAILVLVWWFRVALGDRPEATRGVEREDAAEVELRGAFARGEIDDDEFDRRLKVLRESRHV